VSDDYSFRVCCREVEADTPQEVLRLLANILDEQAVCLKGVVIAHQDSPECWYGELYYVGLGET